MIDITVWTICSYWYTRSQEQSVQTARRGLERHWVSRTGIPMRNCVNTRSLTPSHHQWPVYYNGWRGGGDLHTYVHTYIRTYLRTYILVCMFLGGWLSMDLQTEINLQKFTNFCISCISCISAFCICINNEFTLPNKYLLLCMHVQRSHHAGDTCKM